MRLEDRAEKNKFYQEPTDWFWMDNVSESHYYYDMEIVDRYYLYLEISIVILIDRTRPALMISGWNCG